jgi:hypothetical protein
MSSVLVIMFLAKLRERFGGDFELPGAVKAGDEELNVRAYQGGQFGFLPAVHMVKESIGVPRGKLDEASVAVEEQDEDVPVFLKVNFLAEIEHGLRDDFRSASRG